MVEKADDEVFCTSCGETIKETDEICPECGVRQFVPDASEHDSSDTLLNRVNEDRPATGGAFVILGGLVLIYIPLVAREGFSFTGGNGETFGLIGLIIGLLVIASGVVALKLPSKSKLSGIAAIALSISSIFLGSFGGLGLGSFFGVVGGILCIRWNYQDSISVSRPASTAFTVAIVVFLFSTFYYWEVAGLLGAWIGIPIAAIAFVVVYIIGLIANNS